MELLHVLLPGFISRKLKSFAVIGIITRLGSGRTVVTSPPRARVLGDHMSKQAFSCQIHLERRFAVIDKASIRQQVLDNMSSNTGQLQIISRAMDYHASILPTLLFFGVRGWQQVVAVRTYQRLISNRPWAPRIGLAISYPCQVGDAGC